MGYKLISVKCPDCGQTLSIEEDRTQAFCTYCGAKVLISNENEYVFRQVDEADIKKAETERLIKLKELELQERREVHGLNLRRVLTVIWLFISIILLAIIITKMAGSEDGFESGFMMLLYIGMPFVGGGAYLIFKWLPEKEDDKVIEKQGGIRFPNGIAPFSDKKYFAVESSLRSAGFTSISCVNLHDLNIISALVNNEKVYKITINGQNITSGGRMYMPDVPVVITYHGR